VFLAGKKFRIKADGKHAYTSIESYDIPNAAKYQLVQEEELEKKASELCTKAFEILRFSDYAKFDIRVDENLTPYFIDCNPNTALGPGDQPMTQVMGVHGIDFADILASLLSYHVKSPVRPKEI